MSAPDIQQVQDYVRHVDSAIEAASQAVDALTQRRFWNAVETLYFDWPNFQRAYPWRIWLDAAELADVTAVPPVLMTGTQVIPDSAVFWGPANYAPPYTYLELDRSQSYAFGDGPTPQRNVSLTALRGYWNQVKPAGSLAAAVIDTISATVTVSDSSDLGVGDVLVVGSESLLVRDAGWADTGQVQTGSGCSTDSAADVQLLLGSGAAVHPGEVLMLDSEMMLAVSVAGSTVTVQRAYGGSVIADHSGASVYAQRLLTVTRGFGNSAAAAHLSGTAVSVQLVPGDARELAIAEALNFIYQKTSAYGRTIGEGGASTVPGGSLPDLRLRVLASLGRKGRQRVA
jgi:hypothetical protein